MTTVKLSRFNRDRLEQDRKHFEKLIGGGKWSLNDAFSEYLKIVLKMNKKRRLMEMVFVSEKCVCPDCGRDICLLSEWGYWHFYCSCGWKSKVFSRYEKHPDEITQKELI